MFKKRNPSCPFCRMPTVVSASQNGELVADCDEHGFVGYLERDEETTGQASLFGGLTP